MITDLKAFCELFYASTSIPIGYYHASPDDDCSFPSILEDPSVFKGILSGFRHFTKNPDYFIAQSFSYYGYIKPEHADCVIIIGPVFSTPISDLTLRTFMQEWAISQEHKPDILQFLVNIPQISFNQFLQTLAWLHLCFNDEYISVGQHFNLENTSIISEFSNVHSNQVMNAKEEQHFHNTYHFEQKLLQYIQNGDVEKMKTLLNTPPNYQVVLWLTTPSGRKRMFLLQLSQLLQEVPLPEEWIWNRLTSLPMYISVNVKSCRIFPTLKPCLILC